MQTELSVKPIWSHVHLLGLVLLVAVLAYADGGVAGNKTMADLKAAITADAPTLRFQIGPTAWELVRVPAGDFTMGTPPNEPGREDGELPPRRVTITKAFYIGRYETTQAQYQAVMHENPSEFKGDDLAIDQVRYSEALEYCRRLSDLTGVNVTLPTEAQWEYACRAGTNTPYYSGATEGDLNRAGWYRANSGKTVHKIGQKEPNAWGIYDMHGNLYEPSLDYIVSFDDLSTTNPEGKRFATHGAARGGAWMEPPDRCRAGSRIQTNDMFGGMGIRIVINP
jgi:formylglycine-generating enzyme required for sulfatase activity